MAKILLADDERLVRASFRGLFENEGYEVVVAKDGDEAVRLFLEERPDLVLLDVMMPGKNGIAACGEIRAHDATVPILFFTALPSDVSLVRGLGMGADDYIPKERPPEEFLARVGAALRRRAAYAARQASDDVVSIGDVTVDFRAMSVRRGDACESLTRSEAQLLRLLQGEPGRVFSNDEIFAALHGEGYVGDDAAIRSLLLRLKRKLGRVGERIVNERGLGYRFVV